MPPVMRQQLASLILRVQIYIKATHLNICVYIIILYLSSWKMQTCYITEGLWENPLLLLSLYFPWIFCKLINSFNASNIHLLLGTYLICLLHKQARTYIHSYSLNALGMFKLFGSVIFLWCILWPLG